MRKSLIISALIIPALLGIILSSWSYDRETLSIMPFVDTTKNYIHCTKCHSFTDRSSFQDVTNICDQKCLQCHKDLEGHHKTGMKLRKDAGPTVKLRKNGTLACVSCHNLTGARWDGKSWKSQSIFGAAFNFGRKHKTYYLVERNNKGQLCDRCH